MYVMGLLPPTALPASNGSRAPTWYTAAEGFPIDVATLPLQTETEPEVLCCQQSFNPGREGAELRRLGLSYHMPAKLYSVDQPTG